MEFSTKEPRSQLSATEAAPTASSDLRQRLRMAAALSLPFIALGVQWFLWPWIQPYVWFLFFPTVVFGARLGGYRVGLVVTVLSVLIVWYFFMSPPLSWKLDAPPHVWSVLIFLLVGYLISEAQHRLDRSNVALRKAWETSQTAQAELARTNEQLRELTHHLEERVAQRTAALKTGEEQMRLFIEHAPAALAMLDRDLRYVMVSRRWMADYQLGNRNILGLHHYEVFPTLPERWKQVHQRGLAGEVIREDEDSFVTQHGRRMWLRWEVRPWPEVGGGIGGIVVYSEDITARKRHEHEIKRLTRLYATLSQLNQVVVKVRSRDQLAREVVRVAVDYGEFKLVWLGQLNPSTQTLTPLASAGGTAEWLPSSPADGGNRGQNGGLSETAIRQNSHCLSNDLNELVAEQPWAAALVASGVQAGAAFPIRIQGALWGVLEVYDGEPGVFQGQEIALLQEAAMDIGYALQNLETDAQREQAEQSLRASENRLRALVIASSDMVFRMSADWGEMLELRGRGFIPDTDAPKRRWLEHYVPLEDRAPVLMAIREAIRRKTVFELEHRVLRADGGVGWVLSRAVPILDLRGHVFEWFGMAGDVTRRKQAEEALRDSERLYHSLLEHLPQSIFRLDLDGRIVFANSHYCRGIGRELNELLGKVDTDLFPPELAAKYWADSCRVMETGQVFEDIEQHQGPDGADQYVHVVKAPLRAEDGGIIGLQGLFWDVTARRRAEISLRESEARMRTLGDNIPGGILYQLYMPRDGQNRYTYMSRGTEKIFGLSADRVLADPQTFWDLIVEEDRPRLVEEQKRAAEALTEFDLEFRQRTVRGEVKWIHARSTPRQLPDGALLWDGVAADITERKRAEDQLRFFARAVEQSPAMIVLTDRAGNIEFVNPKFTRVTGYQPEEVLGKNPRLLKSGKTTSEEYRKLWETIVNGGEWHGEFHNKRKDGTLFWELASISPLRDASGKITHFIGVKEDVTEQKLTQAKFLRAQRVESIGSLAGGIAHDLNNILSPIVMSVPLLQDDDPESRRTLIELIDTSAHRAVGVIKQLLSFAKGREGERQPVQLRHLVKEMVKLARETFPRSIRVEESAASDLWAVLADPIQMHQVLLNLCVNARDAMPSGGRLTLAADNLMVDEHFAAMHVDAKPGPYVRLRVSDTGIGIPEALRERIFESFFTTKDEGKGTGLGLTTVLGIVKDHRGFLSFTSVVDQGTTFEVYLPAVTGIEGSAEEQMMRGSPPRGRGELVLVVDDESSIQEVTRRTLEHQGYQVQLAQDGIAALAIFAQRRQEVRAVVTNFMMPLMDGVTLCRALRAIDPNLPLIISSGGLQGAEGSQALGPIQHIQRLRVLHRPHNAEQLLHTLGALVQPDGGSAVPPASG